MCHSPFDCIDCSKRFQTPADYKDHTSCISEAEKYQKTLYNGGVCEHNNTPATANLTGSQKPTGPERNNRNQRSRPQGGGRQRGGDRPQWQHRNVNQATGANDTPLGTPIRMSPVNGTPVIEENTQKSRSVVETSKKRGAELEAEESKACFC
jgi:cell growth-regulating nucleolar protein